MPASHRKMKANQVNASPGIPARSAIEKSRADAVTARLHASTVGICKSRKTPKNSGTSASRKSASSYTPAPRNPINGATGCVGPAAKTDGGDRSRPVNPKSTSLLRPIRATARTTLSTAIPSNEAGANRQSRGSTACQTSRPTIRLKGRNHWSVSPSAARPCRSQASAPVRGASAGLPPCQSTPNSYLSKIGRTNARQGKGRRVTDQYERPSSPPRAASPHRRASPPNRDRSRSRRREFGWVVDRTSSRSAAAAGDLKRPRAPGGFFKIDKISLFAEKSEIPEDL